VIQNGRRMAEKYTKVRRVAAIIQYNNFYGSYLPDSHEITTPCEGGVTSVALG
jgi:hypothetical protein